MTDPRVGVAFALSTLVAGIAAAAVALTYSPRATASPGTTAAPVRGARGIRDARLRVDTVITLVVVRAPFRTERRPSGTPFLLEPLAPQAASASKPARPSLRLIGFVAGRTPVAVLEGVPGRLSPWTAHVGDTAGGLTMRGVSARAVQVSGHDTTWTLTPRIGER